MVDIHDKAFEAMTTAADKTNVVLGQNPYSKYTSKARNLRGGEEFINPDRTPSTVRMRHEFIEGRWVAFPTLFNKWKGEKGKWKEFKSYKDEEKDIKSIKSAYTEAKKRGELFEFGQDSKSASEFALGAWKRRGR